jgi:hypothetical protein
VSSVSNGLYFLTLPLVSVTARYLYIKRNVKKVGGARYTLGARYLSKNTVVLFVLNINDNGRDNSYFLYTHENLRYHVNKIIISLWKGEKHQ